MIGRLWRGWTTPENADAYEELFREQVHPELRDIDGFVEAYVLRRDTEDEEEVEIKTITLFESMEAIEAFAEADPTVAHVTPEAKQLLSRFEEAVVHYDVAIAPE